MPLTCGDRQESWESLYSKEIKSVKPKGSQPWIFIGRTDAEAEALILWPPDVNSQFTGKDPDAGKDWGQEQKGATMNKMVGWYHQLTGYELSKVWEILKDREAWRAAVHVVAKSQTQLSDWTTTRGLRQFRRWPCFWAPWLWPWGKTPQSMVDL